MLLWLYFYCSSNVEVFRILQVVSVCGKQSPGLWAHAFFQQGGYRARAKLQPAQELCLQETQSFVWWKQEVM